MRHISAVGEGGCLILNSSLQATEARNCCFIEPLSNKAQLQVHLAENISSHETGLSRRVLMSFGSRRRVLMGFLSFTWCSRDKLAFIFLR